MSLCLRPSPAGIHAYLQQCRERGCSLISVRAQPPPVVVELLYHTNVRLLKQGRRGITRWQPDRPQPVGLRWLMQPFMSRARPASH